MFSAIVAIEASRAAISAEPVRDIAQRFFQVIALDIDHHVGHFKLFRIGGYQRLLLIDAARDELLDLRSSALTGRRRVEQPDFQKLRVLGRWTPMTNLGSGLSCPSSRPRPQP